MDSSEERGRVSSRAAIAERCKLFEGVAWVPIKARLTRLARRRGCLPPEAEDAAQDAIGRAHEPRFVAWDRENEPDLFAFVGRILLDRLRRRRRTAAAKAERLTSDGTTPEQVAADASPESTAGVHERKHAIRDDVTEHVRGNALLAEVADVWFEQSHSAAEHAEALGVPVRRIHRARERLTSIVEAAVATRDAEEAAEMERSGRRVRGAETKMKRDRSR